MNKVYKSSSLYGETKQVDVRKLHYSTLKVSRQDSGILGDLEIQTQGICVCGHKFEVLTKNHIETVHNMSMNQFFELYPEMRKFKINMCSIYNCVKISAITDDNFTICSHHKRWLKQKYDVKEITIEIVEKESQYQRMLEIEGKNNYNTRNEKRNKRIYNRKPNTKNNFEEYNKNRRKKNVSTTNL